MCADLPPAYAGDDGLYLREIGEKPLLDAGRCLRRFCQRDRRGHGDAQQDVTFLQRGREFGPEPRSGKTARQQKRNRQSDRREPLPNKEA